MTEPTEQAPEIVHAPSLRARRQQTIRTALGLRGSKVSMDEACMRAAEQHGCQLREVREWMDDVAVSTRLYGWLVQRAAERQRRDIDGSWLFREGERKATVHIRAGRWEHRRQPGRVRREDERTILTREPEDDSANHLRRPWPDPTAKDRQTEGELSRLIGRFGPSGALVALGTDDGRQALRSFLRLRAEQERQTETSILQPGNPDGLSEEHGAVEANDDQAEGPEIVDQRAGSDASPSDVGADASDPGTAKPVEVPLDEVLGTIASLNRPRDRVLMFFYVFGVPPNGKRRDYSWQAIVRAVAEQGHPFDGPERTAINSATVRVKRLKERHSAFANLMQPRVTDARGDAFEPLERAVAHRIMEEARARLAETARNDLITYYAVVADANPQLRYPVEALARRHDIVVAAQRLVDARLACYAGLPTDEHRQALKLVARDAKELPATIKRRRPGRRR